MDPFTTGALITGGAGIVGGLLGNDASAREAGKNRDFQEKMSSTARQRDMQDLQRAGLNPLLAAMGSGSSTPSGATASQEDFLSKGITSAIGAQQLKQQIEKNEAEIGLLKSQKNKTNTEERVLRKDIPKSDFLNDAYEMVKPVIKRIKETSTTGAQTKPSDRDRDIHLQHRLKQIKLGLP